MTMKRLVVITCAALALAGCSTPRGGTGEEMNTSYGEEGAHPEPVNSPNMHPGLNPQDIRDPIGLTVPQAPPTTPP